MKLNNLNDFLDFIKCNKLDYVELFVSRTLCSGKWFNHWDLPTLKFYPYCKKFKPVLKYYCFPEFTYYDGNVQMSVQDE